MSALLPPARPRISTDELTVRLQSLHIDRAKYPIIVVGIRGYYRDSMGKPGVNDRMLYDDMIALVTPNVTLSCNGNTDPNGYRRGKGAGSQKGMASLEPGFWPAYKLALHKGQYLAICQRAGEVTVKRDGNPDYLDTGWFGINIHRGGVSGTSSEGCQTIPPAQWEAFITLAKSEAKRLWGDRWDKEVIGYALLEAK